MAVPLRMVPVPHLQPADEVARLRRAVVEERQPAVDEAAQLPADEVAPQPVEERRVVAVAADAVAQRQVALPRRPRPIPRRSRQPLRPIAPSIPRARR